MERGVERWTVDCFCGAKDDDGERMLACDVCGVWQHTGCAGIPDLDAIHARFICLRSDRICTSAETTTTRPKVQKIERLKTLEKEHKDALERAVSLNIPHAVDADEEESAESITEESSQKQEEDATISKEQCSDAITNWNEVVEKLFNRDETGKLRLNRDATGLIRK
ncbi:phd finger protein [Nicotiana attenuata]|uniref:Phd finger protein n=1 Tax=Nicotiana attenuata TaxID=49451 RepID=A0A1J6KG91_NICAT|nr:phd finger protein [Nicotiana attenuata]